VQLRSQEEELRHWRGLVAARGQQARELRERLEARDRKAAAEIEALQAELTASQARLRNQREDFSRLQMQREDTRAHCGRLLEAKDQEVRLLEDRNQALREKHQHIAIARARDGGALGARQKLLEERQQRVATLQSEFEALDGVTANLDSDLRSILTFMMRKIIKSGGEKRSLLQREMGIEDCFPPALQEWLSLSEHSQGLLDACATRAFCASRAAAAARPRAAGHSTKASGSRRGEAMAKASLEFPGEVAPAASACHKGGAVAAASGAAQPRCSVTSPAAVTIVQRHEAHPEAADHLSVSVRTTPLAKCRARWDRCATSGGQGGLRPAGGLEHTF